MTTLRLGDRSTAGVFEYEGRFYAGPLGRGCGISLGDDPKNDEELCDVVYDILRSDFDRKTQGYGWIGVRIEVESMD